MKSSEDSNQSNIELKSNQPEPIKVFPDESNLRDKVLKRAKTLNWVGWGISGLAIIFLIVLWASFKAYYIAYMVGILMIGQAVRFYARELNKRAHNPRSAMTKRQLKQYKEQQEQIVKDYFNKNTKIAEKVLQMNNFAKDGKYNDAYNIARSLLRKKPPQAVKNFLINKKELYLSYIQGFKDEN
ncbi:MAG: hypothetical protein GF364_03685 [Candidatus Lokiarchaeota archaeon]|nr:hypothetical protein [Candidatus Lokiarchaeota archaeon]